MRKIITAAVMLCAASFGYQQQARAANIAVDVDINLPSILVLYCYTNVDVTVSTAALAALLGVAGADNTVSRAGPGLIAASESAGDLVGAPGTALDTTFSTSADMTDVKLNMNDICAFRAIEPATGNGVNVDATVTDNTLTNGTSTITFSNPLVRASAPGFSVDEDVTAGLGLGNAIPIDVQVQMDMSSASIAGDYVDGAVTVVALVNP